MGVSSFPKSGPIPFVEVEDIFVNKALRSVQLKLRECIVYPPAERLSIRHSVCFPNKVCSNDPANQDRVPLSEADPAPAQPPVETDDDTEPPSANSAKRAATPPETQEDESATKYRCVEVPPAESEDVPDDA